MSVERPKSHAVAKADGATGRDPLTGLADRDAFRDAVDRAIARAGRETPGLAVLFLEVDRFDEANDALGQPVGDPLLRKIAARLGLNVRHADVVARLGGAAFAVLGADIGQPEGAASLAMRLLEVVGRPVTIAGREVRCTASVGVVYCDRGTSSAVRQLSRADVALYRAKADGGGGYCVFTESMVADVRDRIAMSAALRAEAASRE